MMPASQAVAAVEFPDEIRLASPGLVDSAALLRDIQQRLPQAMATIESALSADQWPFACDAVREKRYVQVLGADTFCDIENCFLIGDIHGDFFALATLLEVVSAQTPDFKLFFLGDLVDRGEQHAECLVLLFEFACKFPGRVTWIAGNHDIAFKSNAADKPLESAVEPSECLDYVNDPNAKAAWRKTFGSLLTLLPGRLPRAVLLPGGLLLSHGGFPLADRLGEAKEIVEETKRDWLELPQNLQDFTWTRITRYPKKIPNRAHKGCQYGYLDFQNFCTVMGDSFPVKRLVVGHEHPESGWELHDHYPALVLSGFGFHYLYDAPEKFAHYKKQLIAARCRRDALPQRIFISYMPAQLAPIYPQTD